MHQFLDYEINTKNSLRNGMPVIGIETSSIFTLLEYPKNVQTALMIKKQCESMGVNAAFIAVIDGRIKVGLTPDEIENLALKNSKSIINSSILSYTLLKKYSGTLDLNSTLIISKLVGIKIVSTDAIKEHSININTLTNHNILVVSSGFFDINYQSTLKLIKNHNIPLIGFDTNKLPLLFQRSSDLYLDNVIIDEKEVVDYLKIQTSIIDFSCSILVYPISVAYKTYNLQINDIFDKINLEAQNETRLFQIIHEYTKNDSVITHTQSVVQNARLASVISSIYFNNNF